MITDFKPYPSMKRSSVEWIGEVPEHWEIRRLRNCSEIRVSNVDKHSKDNELPVRLCNYVDVYKNDRIRSSMNLMRATATVDEIERFRLRPGDVLVTKDSETWDDIGVPALVENARKDMVSGYHLVLLRPSPKWIRGEYLLGALQSTAIAYQFHVEAKGVTRFGLSHRAVKSVQLPVPPLAEQRPIVRFLGHADRRIRRFIRSRQKLITLLKEYTQAIIHQAVTGQIDVRTSQPYPAYKPSGVEWLGDVPEHWNVKRLHQCGKFAGGMTPSMENRQFWDGEIPWVTPKDMKRESISDSSVRVAIAAVHETSLRLMHPPAVLIVVRGMILARRVPVAWTIGPVTINQDMKALRPRPGINAEFLAHLLNSAQGAFVPLIDEAGHGTRRLPTERLRNLVVAIPPPAEQRSILDSLRISKNTIVEASNLARREVTLLREYRTRLIADVVTGKLDVREAAAQLLDEVDDSAPLAESHASTDIGVETIGNLDALTQRTEA